MRTVNDKITFEYHDLPFLQKHGLSKAVAIYNAHQQTTDLPFLQDFHQLAGFLHMNTKVLFDALRTCDRQYRKVLLKKSSGGYRVLQVPADPLKQIQRKILRSIVNPLPVSPYASAYHPGAKLIHNAQPHCQKKYLLKMDLENFFGSITFEQVLSSTFHSGRFPKHIGAALTTLCCKDGVLPQGAPTSPALSNLVMTHFDEVMGSWCEQRGLAYTRYCDDITVSGNAPLYGAYRKISNFLENMGFSVNPRKTRFVTAANRQTVTGLTVNQKVCIPADYKRALRQDLYYTFRFGAEDHIRRRNLTRFMVEDKAYILQYLDHLQGRTICAFSRTGQPVFPGGGSKTGRLSPAICGRYRPHPPLDRRQTGSRL